MDKFEQKYKVFLESLRNQAPELMDTIIKGFEITRIKPTENNNPYALLDIFETPKPYYDDKANNKKVEIKLRQEEIKIIEDVCNKFNIKPFAIKDDYLLYNQHLAPFQYLEKIKNLTEWKTRAFYNNDKDEYYGVVKKGYEIPLNNRYGNSNISSGGH